MYEMLAGSSSFGSAFVCSGAVARVVDANFDLKVDAMKEWAYDFFSFSSSQKPHSLVRLCRLN